MCEYNMACNKLLWCTPDYKYHITISCSSSSISLSSTHAYACLSHFPPSILIYSKHFAAKHTHTHNSLTPSTHPKFVFPSCALPSLLAFITFFVKILKDGKINFHSFLLIPEPHKNVLYISIIKFISQYITSVRIRSLPPSSNLPCSSSISFQTLITLFSLSHNIFHTT